MEIVFAWRSQSMEAAFRHHAVTNTTYEYNNELRDNTSCTRTICNLCKQGTISDNELWTGYANQYCHVTDVYASFFGFCAVEFEVEFLQIWKCIFGKLGRSVTRYRAKPDSRAQTKSRPNPGRSRRKTCGGFREGARCLPPSKIFRISNFKCFQSGV